MPIRSPYATLNSTTPELPVLKVSEAIAVCNELFSGLSMSVEGEVANYSLSRGQFVFFDLKDEAEEARMNCFMMIQKLSSPLENGMRVVVYAKPGLYQKNGQFRLSVTRVEPKGEGSLKRAFELLRLKLQTEGLFSSARKRSLPRFPKNVAIISSEDAAGYGDFCTIVRSRLPGVSYSLANVAVQGKDAETEICAAFDYLNSYGTYDVIVLIRGGGSMEDLHAFNSESVARAITRSKVPVLVGVGHERDTTIADFCADIRAATPSNAAQLLVPTTQEVVDLVSRLTSNGKSLIEKSVDMIRERTRNRIERLTNILSYRITEFKNQVTRTLKNIEAVSPENTLKRGYTLTWNSDGTLVRSVKSIAPSTHLISQFADGTVESVTQ